jgi:hypothetical protein
MFSKMELKQMLEVLETNGRFIKNILEQYSEVRDDTAEMEAERDGLRISEQQEEKTEVRLDVEPETDFKQNDSVTQKKLFSYNRSKNPKVDYFFNAIDNGMHSFYIRKAIEFYVDNSPKFKNV